MKRIFSLFTLLLLWGSVVCPAQELALRDTIAMSSVTAYSSRGIVPESRMEGAALERLSSNSVADALKYFSGVQIKDYGGIGGLKTVNVRSLGSQHIGVFLDGVRIENAQNGTVDLGRYSLDNMESVSLYNAQKAETLQSASEYSSGATVYMRTRRPVFGGKDFNIKARIKGGSFGSVNPSLRYERKMGKMSLAADGMFMYSEGDYRFRIKNSLEDTTARRSNGDIRAWRAETVLWSPLFGGQVQAHAYFYDSERGLPGPVIRRLSDQYSSKDRQWDRNYFAQLSYKRESAKSAVLFNAKGSYDYLEYLSDPAENPAAIYVHNTYKQRAVFASAAYAWYPYRWLSMNFAGDIRWSDLKCDVTGFSYVSRLDLKGVAAATVVYGGFSANASALCVYVKDRKKSNAPDPMSRISPSLSAAWRGLDGRLKLRAFYKSVFRTPTLNDLYYVFVGNVQLKPEKARQLDFGIDLYSPSSSRTVKAKVSVDGYLSRVSDKIVAMPVASQFRWSMMNFGKVCGGGIDAKAELSADLGKLELSSLFSYSYEEARDRSERKRITWGGQIPYTPWHSFSAVLGAAVGQWNGNVSVLYTGPRYRSADNVRSERMRRWMTVDLSLSRRIMIRRLYGMEVGLDVNNILDQHYEVVTRYPMPGANFMAKVTLNI